MAAAMDTSVFVHEFGSDIERERQRWLRRRFLWYTGVTSAFGLLFMLPAVYAVAFPGDEPRSPQAATTDAITIFLGIIGLVLYLHAYLHVLRVKDSRWHLLRIVFWLIVVTGSLSILTGPIVVKSVVEEISLSQRRAQVDAAGGERSVPINVPAVGAQGLPIEIPTTVESDEVRALRESRERRNQRVGEMISLWGIGLVQIGQIFWTHLIACMFLPWTPRESLRPIVPLLALNALVTVAYLAYAQGIGAGGTAVWVVGLSSLLISPLVAAPGAGICWWRYSRFRDESTSRLLKGRYAEMKRELYDARKIHESLFPAPITQGPIRLGYVYEPMRQIGGDYLFAFAEPVAMTESGHGIQGGPGVGGRLSVVIMDVTGHGIAAALTVNRLYGELTRVFAENPRTPPGDVLRLLNKYIHLTLATHSVYVTAFCCRVDGARDVLEYASGGHPPAYVRRSDGTFHELKSTTFVLGACADRDFVPGEQSESFHTGDRLIAWTDGALEARPAGEKARMIGLQGMLRIAASTKPMAAEGWPRQILQAVENYRQGPPADDTLVVEVVRVG